MFESIIQAIAKMEGFSSGASKVAVANNNPGNIRYWSSNLPVVNGFTKFPNLQMGWDALNKLVKDYATGRYEENYKKLTGKGYATPGKPTLVEIFTTYAPSNDGNKPVEYAHFVAREAKLNPDLPVVNQLGTSYNNNVVEPLRDSATTLEQFKESINMETLIVPIALGLIFAVAVSELRS